MYTGLLHFHSYWRYVFVILVLVALVSAIRGWMGKKEYSIGNAKLNTFTVISGHIQFLTGIILYFISPFVQFEAVMGDKVRRFWAVEHAVTMLLVVALLTIGNRMTKKDIAGWAKHKKMAIVLIIAVVLIAMMVPWPFSAVSRGWFPGS
jgi:hypothetical protein